MRSSALNLIYVLIMFLFINSCDDKEKEVLALETGTLTDIDNNVYKTVKIGNQWWMAENLRTTRYRNGNAIRNAQGVSWSDTLSSYCLYQNIGSAPGLLYNWYAVSDTNNIAPLGWHVPSDEEWKELERTLGMSNNDVNAFSWRGDSQGDQLKIEAYQGWNSFPEVWATNSSGFSAIGGGCRLPSGIFGDPGLKATGFWWSSTLHQDNNAYYRHLDYKNSNVFRYYGDLLYGMSLRCVRD